MLTQKTSTIQKKTSHGELEKEFEIIEKAMMRVYDILDEFDRLMKDVEFERKKLEVNQ